MFDGSFPRQPFWKAFTAVGKEAFFVFWNIRSAGSGYEGAYGAGSSAPLGLAGATIKEGTIERTTSGKTAKSFNSFEPSATEAPGLHGQVFKTHFCKVEAENQQQAIEFAGEIYGEKGGLGFACKTSEGEFKKG